MQDKKITVEEAKALFQRRFGLNDVEFRYLDYDREIHVGVFVHGHFRTMFLCENKPNPSIFIAEIDEWIRWALGTHHNRLYSKWLVPVGVIY
jgi:hypothetical protein